MKEPSPEELTDLIHQVKSLKVTQLGKFDAILSDLANYMHDAGEYLSEIPEVATDFEPGFKKENLVKLKALKKQLTTVGKLLWKTGYESHYMDRCLHTLEYVNEDLDKLIDVLEE
jgi:hypothetical protein